jgi:hypothetical protein
MLETPSLHSGTEIIFHFTLRRERGAGDDGDAEIRTFPIMTRRFPVWGSLEKLTLTPTALRFGVSLLRAPDRDGCDSTASQEKQATGFGLAG